MQKCGMHEKWSFFYIQVVLVGTNATNQPLTAQCSLASQASCFPSDSSVCYANQLQGSRTIHVACMRADWS